MQGKDYNRLKFNKSLKKNRHRGQKLKNIHPRCRLRRYMHAYKHTAKKKFSRKKLSYKGNNTDATMIFLV